MSSYKTKMQWPTQKLPNTINPQDKRNIHSHSVGDLLSIEVTSFGMLSLAEQEIILTELKSASTDVNISNAQKIIILNKVINLATEFFSNLTQVGQERVLASLLELARLECKGNRWHMPHIKKAVNLGKPIFLALSPESQRHVLIALKEICYNYRMMHWDSITSRPDNVFAYVQVMLDYFKEVENLCASLYSHLSRDCKLIAIDLLESVGVFFIKIRIGIVDSITSTLQPNCAKSIYQCL